MRSTRTCTMASNKIWEALRIKLMRLQTAPGLYQPQVWVGLHRIHQGAYRASLGGGILKDLFKFDEVATFLTSNVSFDQCGSGTNALHAQGISSWRVGLDPIQRPQMHVKNCLVHPVNNSVGWKSCIEQ